MGGIPRVRPEEQLLHDRDWEAPRRRRSAARRAGHPAFFLGTARSTCSADHHGVLASGVVHWTASDRGPWRARAGSRSPRTCSWPSGRRDVVVEGHALRRDDGIVPTGGTVDRCAVRAVAFGIGLLVNLILQLVVFKNSSPGTTRCSSSAGCPVQVGVLPSPPVRGDRRAVTEETLVRGALWGRGSTTSCIVRDSRPDVVDLRRSCTRTDGHLPLFCRACRRLRTDDHRRIGASMIGTPRQSHFGVRSCSSVPRLQLPAHEVACSQSNTFRIAVTGQ